MTNRATCPCCNQAVSLLQAPSPLEWTLLQAWPGPRGVPATELPSDMHKTLARLVAKGWLTRSGQHKATVYYLTRALPAERGPALVHEGHRPGLSARRSPPLMLGLGQRGR